MRKCCAATSAQNEKTPHVLDHPLQAAVSSHSFIGGLVSAPTNFAVCHLISGQICLPLRKWRPSAKNCFNQQTRCPSALPTSLRTVESTVCENHACRPRSPDGDDVHSSGRLCVWILRRVSYHHVSAAWQSLESSTSRKALNVVCWTCMHFCCGLQWNSRAVTSLICIASCPGTDSL